MILQLKRGDVSAAVTAGLGWEFRCATRSACRYAKTFVCFPFSDEQKSHMKRTRRTRWSVTRDRCTSIHLRNRYRKERRRRVKTPTTAAAATEDAREIYIGLRSEKKKKKCVFRFFGETLSRVGDESERRTGERGTRGDYGRDEKIYYHYYHYCRRSYRAIII